MKLFFYAVVSLILISGPIYGMHKNQKDLDSKLLGAVFERRPLKEIYDLVSQGANVNATYKQFGFVTPLMGAVDNGNLDIIKFLLDKKADMYAYDLYSHEVLTYIYGGASYNIRRTKPDQIIKLFLDHGYPVNRRIDQVRDTLLHKAIIFRDCNSVKLLLERGAYSFLKNELGESPVDKAIGRGHCLFILAKSGIQASKGILQANRKIINDPDESGNTLLHHAVLAGDDAWVAYLLSMGADPTIKNKSGLTPLELAIEIGGPSLKRIVGIFTRAVTPNN